jgi:hypothetical protein
MKPVCPWPSGLLDRGVAIGKGFAVQSRKPFEVPDPHAKEKVSSTLRTLCPCFFRVDFGAKLLKQRMPLGAYFRAVPSLSSFDDFAEGFPGSWYALDLLKPEVRFRQFELCPNVKDCPQNVI